jgi:peptide/nickel transport system substrate-binding protein
MSTTRSSFGRPKLDRVVLMPVADPAAGMTQVLSGQSDFMEAFPIDQVGKLDSSTVARPLPLPNLGYAFLGFNKYARKSKTTAHPILSDVRVRRAISLATDRQAMLRNVFGSVGRISYGPFPRVHGAADTTLALPPYDTVAAKATLDSAGWKPGPDGVRSKNGQRLQLNILTPSSSQFRRRYAVLLQDALKRVGIQTDVDTPDVGAFLERTGAGDYDMVLNSYSVDPSVSGSKQNWGSAFIGQTGMNDLRYANPKVDALLDTASSSFDAAKSKSAASRAYQTIIDDVPAVFLYDILFVAAVNRRFETLPPRSDGWWVHLADWSVPADKRIDRDRIGLGSAQP